MAVKPISPTEAEKSKIKNIPDSVIEVWNKVIAQKYRNGYLTIYQDEIVGELASAMNVSRDVIFASGWLDIESIYRASGWDVEYDKPGYNETYRAYFKFNKKSWR